MKLHILLAIPFAVFAAESQPLPVVPECQAIVTRAPNPQGIIQVAPHYDLVKCDDIQFNGGGVVIRYVVNSLTGEWAMVYYPAHQIKTVEVKPKPK